MEADKGIEGRIDFRHTSFIASPITLTCSDIEHAAPLINKTAAFLKLFEQSALVRQYYHHNFRILLNPTAPDFSFVRLKLSVMGQSKQIDCNLDQCCGEDLEHNFVFSAAPIATQVDAVIAQLQLEAQQAAAAQVIYEQRMAAYRGQAMREEDIIASQMASQQEIDGAVCGMRVLSIQAGRVMSGAVMSQQVIRSLSERPSGPSDAPEEHEERAAAGHRLFSPPRVAADRAVAKKDDSMHDSDQGPDVDDDQPSAAP